MLVANAIGAFCLTIKKGDLSNYGTISMGDHDNNLFMNKISETPLYMIIGVGGGVLGGAFSAAMIWMRRRITSKFPTAGKGRSKWQLFEVALVSIISSVIIFYLPQVAWACKPEPENATATETFYAEQERKRFFCPSGEINEMALMMFGSRIAAIKDILTDPSVYQQRTLIYVGFSFYVLTLITFGTAIPSGIFTPLILSGASLGGAMGNFFKLHIDSTASPSTFALLGVAAMLAGIQRSTVSSAVILVESTGNIKILVPVIIVSVVARAVAQSINTLGVFGEMIKYKNYPYLRHEHLKRYYDAVQVKDIMSPPPVVSLRPKEKVGDLETLLQTFAHNGFPVVEGPGHKFLGLVKRSQIAALLEAGIFSKSSTSKEEENLVASEFGINVRSSNEKGGTSQMYHWAYHINDDRYDHILSIPDEEVPVAMRKSPLSWLSKSLEKFDHHNDEEEMFSTEGRSATDNKSLVESVLSTWQTVRKIPRQYFGADSVSSILTHSSEFATVKLNDAGNVVVDCNSQYRDYWVDVAAVANRGTYTVQEFSPVSKAYTLCE